MFNEYKTNLENQKNRVNQKNAQDDVKKFYEQNKEDCEKAYSCYCNYNLNKNSYIKKPKSIDKNSLLDIIKGKIIFIITANPIEEAILMSSLSKFYNSHISSYYVQDNVYQIISLEKYTLIHTHALKTGDENTRRSINYATRVFLPDYIILLGVCYGIDYLNYDLGTVFLSDKIEGFRINFKDNEDDEDTLFEAEIEFEEQPNKNLINRMSSFFNSFQPVNDFFSLETKKVNVKVIIGKLLSSNSLMSSKKVKEAVMLALGAEKKQPLGGEMEACGIFKSNFFDEKEFNNWLVVKSICDWGEKKNSLSKDMKENEKIKDSIQAYAMMNTWIIFKTMLENELLN